MKKQQEYASAGPGGGGWWAWPTKSQEQEESYMTSRPVSEVDKDKVTEALTPD